ncbi:MAG: hypothetical protein WCP72_12025, partial [Desulfomonile sp.]
VELSKGIVLLIFNALKSIANHVDNRLLRCDKSFQSIADSDAHFFQKNVQEDLIMAQFMRANIMPT